MTKVTVKQLAESVKVPVDRLVKQMQEAGLKHNSDADLVSEDEKQKLLEYLQKSRGDAQDSKKKITLKRKSTGTIKQGQGRAGRDVTVEVRRKRTYVKNEDLVKDKAEEQKSSVKQSELEAQKIREEESARLAAEEKTRLEEQEALAESKRKAEQKLEEEAARGKEDRLQRQVAAGNGKRKLAAYFRIAEGVVSAAPEVEASLREVANTLPDTPSPTTMADATDAAADKAR